MAKFNTNVQFNIKNYNFNWYSENYWDEDLYQGINERYEGVFYEDILSLNGFYFNFDDSYYADYYLGLFGNNITGSIYSGTLSGTITSLHEGFYDAYDAYYMDWDMIGTSLSASEIRNAISTSSKSDDLALFSNALKGNDTIKLSAYDDRMMGFAGKDTIYGYAGKDTIEGGEGSDRLFGGIGADRLYGGNGADDFVFNDGETGKGSSARDIIYDFIKGIDDLELSLIDANSKKSGDQKFDFGGTSAGRNDVWYKKSGSDTIVYGDTNCDGKADFEIELRGVSSLSAGDFIL